MDEAMLRLGSSFKEQMKRRGDWIVQLVKGIELEYQSMRTSSCVDPYKS